MMHPERSRSEIAAKGILRHLENNKLNAGASWDLASNGFREWLAVSISWLVVFPHASHSSRIDEKDLAGIHSLARQQLRSFLFGDVLH